MSRDYRLQTLGNPEKVNIVQSTAAGSNPARPLKYDRFPNPRSARFHRRCRSDGTSAYVALLIEKFSVDPIGSDTMKHPPETSIASARLMFSLAASTKFEDIITIVDGKKRKITDGGIIDDGNHHDIRNTPFKKAYFDMRNGESGPAKNVGINVKIKEQGTDSYYTIENSVDSVPANHRIFLQIKGTDVKIGTFSPGAKLF